MVGSLQPRRDLLLNALRSKSGKWMKRKDIAVQIGTTVLSRGDVVLLHTLAEQGIVEIREAPGKIPDTTRFEYRVLGE